MRETSSRMIFVAVCAWMSVCLLIGSWLPDLGNGLRFMWMVSGLTGLVSSVGLSEVIKKDIQRQEQVLQKYMAAALTDGLTGLANRQAFDQALTTTLAHMTPPRDRISVLLIDADHFKGINDTYGHQAGDDALRFLANTAATFFEGDGAVARYGGEEFAVALPGYRLKDAVSFAKRFRELVERTPCACGDKSVPITVSIGVAEAYAGENGDELIHRADMALYSAKRMGRNCVWFADPKPDSAAEMILEAITATV